MLAILEFLTFYFMVAAAALVGVVWLLGGSL